MIQILRGPSENFRGFVASAPNTVVLPSPRGPIRAWHGCRQLLPHLREALGDRELEAQLHEHRDQLRLALGHLVPGRPVSRARLPSFVSHNGVVRQPLREAWIAVLGELLPRVDFAIALPEACRFDVESLSVLRSVAWLLGDECPSLQLGYDPDAAPQGLHARRSFDLAETEIVLMESLPGARVKKLAALGSTDTEPGDGLVFDPVDDDLDGRAFEQLTIADEREIDASLVLAALRASFDAQGFATAIELGLRLLSRCGADLPPATTAEVHHLVAISAYNRHVESAGSTKMALFIEEHIEAALAHEQDPALRGCLLQRLAMNTARKQGQLQKGLLLTERGLETVRDASVGSPVLDFTKAWLHNARAYINHLSGQPESAIEQCRDALMLVEPLREPTGIPPGELLATRLIFLDNLAELHEAQGDLDGASRWQERLEREEEAVPRAMRLAAHRWLRILQQRPGELRRAIELARRGLDDARRFADIVHEDRYTTALGELLYRAGEAREAVRHFEAALKIRRRFALVEDVVRGEVALALASVRAGRPEDATTLYAEALKSPLCTYPGARAEVLGAAGVAAAAQGDAHGAEALIDDAIEHAVESAHPVAIVTTARHAGEACLLLGRIEDAREAFERGLVVLSESEESSADFVGLVTGLERSGGANDALIWQAASQLLAALRDPEAWWDLPRLLGRLAAVAASQRELTEIQRRQLRELSEIAALRRDCERVGRQLAELGAS